jgi:hypothetical protein
MKISILTINNKTNVKIKIILMKISHQGLFRKAVSCKKKETTMYSVSIVGAKKLLLICKFNILFYYINYIKIIQFIYLLLNINN